MIALRQFRYQIDGSAILHGIDLTIGAGALCVIAGPNGAGKSTLLRALAGLLPGQRPDPRRIGYLAQNAEPAWNLTVAELVALGRLPHGGGGAEACARALDLCGLSPLAGRRIRTLSGGEQQRAALARVLAGAPACLLLDEPLAALDPAAAHGMMRLLRGLAHAGSAVVVVLHAYDLAARYADRILLMQGGRIAADGVPAELWPKAAEIFGLGLGRSTTPCLLPLDDDQEIAQ